MSISDAQKIANILSFFTGGGGGSEQSGILAQPLNTGGTLISLHCPDGSDLQIILNPFDGVEDYYVSPPEAEECLWAIEGELRFGTSESVG